MFTFVISGQRTNILTLVTSVHLTHILTLVLPLVSFSYVLVIFHRYLYLITLSVSHFANISFGQVFSSHTYLEFIYIWKVLTTLTCYTALDWSVLDVSYIWFLIKMLTLVTSGQLTQTIMT